MGLLIWVLGLLLTLCTRPCMSSEALCGDACPKIETQDSVGNIISEGVDPECVKVRNECLKCLKDSTGPNCKNIEARFKQIEFLQPIAGPGSVKPPGCTETDLDKCDIPQPGRRKRGVPEVDFHPKYVWHQDKIPRPRKCCITTKRVIQYITNCGKDCYPVYCPLAGGHQFIDEVECNINNTKKKREFGVRYFSQPKEGRCKRKKGKKCSVWQTLRYYLVTNVPPQGWWGHCLYDWTPVWFKLVAVPTHCYCKK